MRDKYLRLDRDAQRSEEAFSKEREELIARIDEVKREGILMADPKEMVDLQGRMVLREKNSELMDALIAQERIGEKYKYELKKSIENLEEAVNNNKQLTHENREMKKFV